MATARLLACIAAVLLMGAGHAWGQGAMPQILEQPEDMLVECAGPAISFSVNATGANLSYRWFSNSVAMPNQVWHTLEIPTTTTNMDGALFHVLVSNSVSTVTSRTARLTVHPDTCGPRLLKAVSMDVQGLTNRVALTFDEVTAASSTRTLSNYTITVAGATNILPIASVISGGTRAFLVLATNLYRTNDYVLKVTGISDPRSNNIAPVTQVPILFTYSNFVFGMSQPWKFYDPLDCSLPAGDWTGASYDEDQRWGGPEPGIFWKFSSSATPVPCTGSYGAFSELSVGCTNHYFRTRFSVTADLVSEAALRLDHFVDDGATFYLNGLEIGRYNMAAGSTNATTNAATVCVAAVLPCTNLLAGENVLAVEVGQAGADRFTVAFGIQLTILTDRGPSLPQPANPTLALERLASELHVSWSPQSPNFRLMQAESLDGPWREAQPLMFNPWVTSAGDAMQFYRLESVTR
jgi:hypothetical protein